MIAGALAPPPLCFPHGPAAAKVFIAALLCAWPGGARDSRAMIEDYAGSLAARLEAAHDPYAPDVARYRGLLPATALIHYGGPGVVISVLDWQITAGRVRTSFLVNEPAYQALLSAARDDPAAGYLMDAWMIQEGGHVFDMELRPWFYARLDALRRKVERSHYKAGDEVIKEYAAHLVQAEASGYRDALAYLEARDAVGPLRQWAPKDRALKVIRDLFLALHDAQAKPFYADDKEMALRALILRTNVLPARPELAAALARAGLDGGGDTLRFLQMGRYLRSGA